MRNRLMISTAALLLASATYAGAQAMPQPETTSSGTIDAGGRFTTTDGDEARYERYRDLRDGVNANILYETQKPNWAFDFLAKNIGYRDGRYELNFQNNRVKLTARFDQTPLNYAYYSRTPYNCTAGNCALDAGVRSQVENGQVVGIPQNLSQLRTGSVYESLARQFDLQSRRDTISAELRYSATNNLDFIVGVNSYKRTGNQPYGASWAFNYALELPVVIDNRETELSAAVEWASHQGMFHLGFQHAKFNQNIPSVTFDNPIRATDYCVYGNPSIPPGTCYDPSGYVNGRGAAFGRMSQPPSNTLDTVNWTGMVKLPGRTTANASFSVGASHSDAALIPWTSNASLNTPAVYAAFPALAELPRDSGQLRVNYTTGTMSVSSRAIKDVILSARYRYNGRTAFSHEFDAIEYVRFDAVPEETGGPTEPYNISSNTLDASVAYTGIPRSTIRAGYGFQQYEHSIRATVGWQDNTARISYDFIGNQYVTLRALYEHTKRDTINLSIEELEATGSQPALRFYDEAARNRNRGTFIVDVTPTADFGASFSFSKGKDDYSGADSAQEFGLLSYNNTGWTAGVSYSPSAKVNLGAEYGRETYDSLQESRNANPGAQFVDPRLNWTLANDETMNNVSIYLDLIKALEKTDIRVAYNFNDSDQGFVHGGPRVASLQAANTFIALPNVTKKWHQATIDVRYYVSKKVGIGAFYMYEKFDVSDYATINTAGPQSLPVASLGPQTDTARIDWFGSLETGYASRPYKGQTGIVRVIYEF